MTEQELAKRLEKLERQVKALEAEAEARRRRPQPVVPVIRPQVMYIGG